MLGTFLNFVYGSSYKGTKIVHGYLISFVPQMVQSSYKDHLIRLFLRSTKLKYRLPKGRLFESYRPLSFWRLSTFYGDDYLESFHQDLKTFWKLKTFICYRQFKNYEAFKLNLNCEIIRGNLHTIFALSSIE